MRVVTLGVIWAEVQVVRAFIVEAVCPKVP